MYADDTQMALALAKSLVEVCWFEGAAVSNNDIASSGLPIIYTGRNMVALASVVQERIESFLLSAQACDIP